MTYTTKVYRKPGGDELVVANGGVITVATGGSIAIDGEIFTVIDVDDATIELVEGKLNVKQGGIELVHLADEVTDILDVVGAADDVTLEVADGTLQVKEGGLALVHLATEVTDILDIVAAIPTEDQKDGVSIWNNKGALEVSSS